MTYDTKCGIAALTAVALLLLLWLLPERWTSKLYGPKARKERR